MSDMYADLASKDGNVVKEGHVRYCKVNGHVFSNGVRCDRCDEKYVPLTTKADDYDHRELKPSILDKSF